MRMGWTEDYAKAWGEIYRSTAKTAVASFGDRGDRYIDPSKRRKMRNARRKARSIPTTYQVGFNTGDNVTLRNFKTRKGAVKCYITLKREGYGPHITSKSLGWVTVFTAPRGTNLAPAERHDSTPLVRANADMFSKPHMLPAIVRSSSTAVTKVTKAEVLRGKVIEGTLSLRDSSSRLWAGQSSYVKKRIEDLKGLPILRDFVSLPKPEQVTLQCCLGVPALILAMQVGLLLRAH